MLSCCNGVSESNGLQGLERIEGRYFQQSRFRVGWSFSLSLTAGRIMVKPIGNLIANLKPKDKVSGKTQARFANKSFAPPPPKVGADEAQEQGSAAARPARFKKRTR